MDLTGKTIDRYKILEQLGQGGMAVVYKAFDTRLEREVALKVIRMGEVPQSQRSLLLKRFEREAKSQARFYHAHIVQVFDYGEHEGAPYLVMAYLPGGSLKDRTGQPMPYTEAAALLAPIADALAYAHEMDVLHRDVKPNNILFDAKGEPALADFGIAKVLGDVDEATLTGTGMGIGTPQYMAPEQWEGKPEKATDIYALGVVFYELVTGRKPYDADTPGALIRQQATEMHPSPREIIPDLPDFAVHAMDTALAKYPAERYPSMAAFARALHELAAGASQPITTSVLGETMAVEPTPPPVEVQPTYYPQEEPTESTPPPVPDENKEESDFGIPVPAKPRKRLPNWIWGLAGLVIITGIVLAVTLSGQGAGWLAAATETSLPTSTPSPTITATLPPTPTPYGGGTGSIIFASERSGNFDIWRMDADGSNLIQLTNDESEDRAPSFSPDGSQILFISDRSGNSNIWRMDADGSNLMQLTNYTAEDSGPTFSPDGRQIVFQSNFSGSWRIWRMDADGGNLVQLTDNPALDYAPVFSPDGSQIIFFSNRSGNFEIWQMDTDGGNLVQLTDNPALDYSPIFSPDGSQILFISDRSGNWDIWRMDIDGSNLVQLTDAPESDWWPELSPDGSQIVFISDRTGNFEIWRMDADGSNLVQLTDDETSNYDPVWVPAVSTP